ncbi:MAG TPA: hypothetical protein VJ865_03120 [Gemmatimonadaceae bacterium]|nr:hypothetical protein [Gemmatimonadaceae bacterium]
MTPFSRGHLWILSSSGLVLMAGITAGFSQASQSMSRTPTPITTTDPRQAMVAALGAPGPHPSLKGEARTFDRFVGTWDCDFTFHLPDGSVRMKKGELHFGWVLNGYAVQDIWTTYPTKADEEKSSGTSFRFFDTKSKEWRVVFIQPQYSYVVSVVGGLEGDRIVLRGKDADGNPIRWTFFDMTDTSFSWHGEKSHDGGKTWALEEDHHMRRRNPSG